MRLSTLGKDYLAASAMIELTPLFSRTPNVFVNLRDPGALVQVVMRNDLREDLPPSWLPSVLQKPDLRDRPQGNAQEDLYRPK